MADEVVTLRLDTNAQEAGRDMKQAASSADMLDHALADVFKSSSHVAQAATETNTAVRQVSQVTTSAAESTTRLDVSMRQAQGGSRNLGLAVNALAQGMEDMQYSFAGGFNNFSQFAMLMGAGGLVVAGITVAGVAINQLYNHWSDLKGAFSDTAPVDAMAAAMDKLAKKDLEAASSAETLYGQQKKLKELFGQGTTQDQETGKTVLGAVGAVGPKQAYRDVLDAQYNAMPGNRKDIEGTDLGKRIEQATTDAFLKAMGGDANAQNRIRDLMQTFGRDTETGRKLFPQMKPPNPSLDAQTQAVVARIGRATDAVDEQKDFAGLTDLREKMQKFKDDVPGFLFDPAVKKAMEGFRKALGDAEGNLLTMQGELNETNVDMKESRRAAAESARKHGMTAEDAKKHGFVGPDETGLISLNKGEMPMSFEAFQAEGDQRQFESRQNESAFRRAQMQYLSAGMGGGQSNLMRAMAGMSDPNSVFNRRDNGASRFMRSMAARQSGGRAAIEQRQRAMFEMQRIQNAEQAAQKRFVDVMEKIGRDGIEVKG